MIVESRCHFGKKLYHSNLPIAKDDVTLVCQSAGETHPIGVFVPWHIYTQIQAFISQVLERN